MKINTVNILSEHYEQTNTFTLESLAENLDATFYRAENNLSLINEGIGDTIKSIWEKVKKFIMDLWLKIKTFFKKLWDKLTGKKTEETNEANKDVNAVKEEIEESVKEVQKETQEAQKEIQEVQQEVKKIEVEVREKEKEVTAVPASEPEQKEAKKEELEKIQEKLDEEKEKLEKEKEKLRLAQEKEAKLKKLKDNMKDLEMLVKDQKGTSFSILLSFSARIFGDDSEILTKITERYENALKNSPIELVTTLRNPKDIVFESEYATNLLLDLADFFDEKNIFDKSKKMDTINRENYENFSDIKFYQELLKSKSFLNPREITINEFKSIDISFRLSAFEHFSGEFSFFDKRFISKVDNLIKKYENAPPSFEKDAVMSRKKYISLIATLTSKLSSYTTKIIANSMKFAEYLAAITNSCCVQIINPELRKIKNKFYSKGGSRREKKDKK